MPPDTPPLPISPINNANPWAPFEGQAEFRLADHLFRKVEMSQKDINELLDIWSLYQHQLAECTGVTDENEGIPFQDYREMYNSIDNIHEGGCTVEVFPDCCG